MEPTSSPSRLRPTADEIGRWLEPAATTSERVRALLAIGIHASEISTATSVSVSALRNWSTGQAEPRPDAAITLDDLRATAKILLEAEHMEPPRIANWLRSWNPKLDGRPLDMVARDPMSVRSAAHAETLRPVPVPA